LEEEERAKAKAPKAEGFEPNLQGPEAKARGARRGLATMMPTQLSCFDASYPVKSWADTLYRLCEALLAKKPFAVASFDESKTLNPDGIYFSYIREDIEYLPKMLSNGLYIECDRPSEDLVKACEDAILECGFSPDAFSVKAVAVN